MKRRNTLHSIFLSALLLGLPVAAMAEPADCPPDGAEASPPPGGRHGHWGKHGFFSPDRPPRFLQSLNLTDTQRAQIAEILKTQGAELRDKAEAKRKPHEELRRLAFSADYTDDKAKALVDANAASLAELAILHARLDHALYEVLTPEQQAQLQDKLANFKGRPPKP